MTAHTKILLRNILLSKQTKCLQYQIRIYLSFQFFDTDRLIKAHYMDTYIKNTNLFPNCNQKCLQPHLKFFATCITAQTDIELRVQIMFTLIPCFLLINVY